MPRSKKPTDDCNCHYTGFHPIFGVLPKKKTKPAQAAQMVNPAWNISESSNSSSVSQSKPSKKAPAVAAKKANASKATAKSKSKKP